MSQIRDIFFPEFHEELALELGSIARRGIHTQANPSVVERLQTIWHGYRPSDAAWPFIPIAVDGGVQRSSFSDGWTVSVARACALICRPERSSGPEIVKKLKIHIGRAFGGDRTYVTSYVRMIAEHQAAQAAAEKVLSEGCTPLVIMDGSLYLGRFPYAEREYVSHPKILAEMLDSIASLHALCRDHAFPLVGLSKDSAVFYLYMALLREILVESQGSERLVELLSRAGSPLSFRENLGRAGLLGSTILSDTQVDWPCSDTRLVELSISEAGFSHPLLLAPSIYYRRGDSVPSIHRRIRGLLSSDAAEEVLRALDAFFSRPTACLVYWRPPRSSRAFRLDISASCLGDKTPLRDVKSNILMPESADLSIVRKVLDVLDTWFCNDLEYDVPLHQSDRLARFDSALYKHQYEPYIKLEMQKLGLLPRSRIRDLRS